MTDVSAYITWTPGGDETTWTLEYKVATDANYTVVSCSNPYKQLTGLTPQTLYDVRVKAICDVDDESDYVATTFTTEATPIVTYTITATAGTNGAISPSGQIIVVQGEDTTFTITPDNGYLISALLIDNNSVAITNSYTFSNVQANHTIHADFEAIPDTCHTPTALIADADSMTDVSAYITWTPGGDETAWTLEYKVATDANYTVVNCSNPYKQLTGLTPETQYDVRVKAICDVDDESDYIATTFTTEATPIVTYTITATVGENGSISPIGQIVVVQGADTTFTITPDNGYVIGTLLIDDNSVAIPSDSTYTFTNVQANHTIHADFTVGIEENSLQNSIVVYPNRTIIS